MAVRRLVTVLVAVCLPVAAASSLSAPAGAAAPALTHYTVHADSTVTQLLDASASPCGAAGVVTMNQHLNAEVAATEAGLSNGEVLALLQDDPDGLVRQVGVTTIGGAVYTAGDHVYTGTFTTHFDGHFLPNGMYLQTGTFSLRATSEAGTLLLVASGGHDLDGFDGTTKMFAQHGFVDGCLP